MEQEKLDKGLWRAVRDESVDDVVEWIKRGANVNHKSDDIIEKTPLHYTALNGKTEICELLIAFGSDLTAKDRSGKTPLHNVAENGQTEICKLLISSGSGLTAKDRGGHTPLHLGALNGKTETCKLLISSGSDLTARDYQRQTPLHLGALNGETETCKLLVLSGSDLTARDYQGKDILLCVSNDDFVLSYPVKEDTTKSYDKWKSELSFDRYVSYVSGRTPLHLGATYEKTETCKLLISSGSDLTTRDNQGRTPLHLGAWCGRTETCKLLISSGSDLMARDGVGSTPLHLGASDGHSETCKLLISSGSDLTARDDQGMTPLHLGARYGRTETCKLLILSGSDLTARDRQGSTPLHLGASDGHSETSKLLISSGSDLTARDDQGMTPLHLGARYGRTDTCKLLILSGSDLTARDRQDCTPLHYAAEKGAIEIVKNLLIYGADLTAKNKKGKTPLDVAKQGHTSTFLEKIMNSNIPPEVYLLSSTDSKTFGSILKSGFYRSHVGKVLIVGHEAVGKTAISNVLVGKTPSDIRISTEGIEVHIYQAAIDFEKKKWIPSELIIQDVAYRNLMVSHKFTATELSLLETEEVDGSAEKEEENENETDGLEKAIAMGTEKQETKQKNILYRILTIVGTKQKKKQRVKKITTESLFEETVGRTEKVMGEERNLVPVNMMDFGGQYVFYSTHQSFLTYRGFYLLPVNGSLGFDDEIETESFIPGRFGRPTSRAFVLFWVGSITSCSVGKSKEFPKIFVVLTHRDRMTSKEEATEQAGRIFGEIRKMFQNSEAMAHLVLEPELFINAMDPEDPGYRKLESTIVEHVCSHPTWGEKLPKAWIPLQLALQQNIENGEKVMSIDSLRAINKENPVHILTEQELQVFLKMAHTQGEVIFFPLPGLKDKIILSPSFFVKCLKTLVTESSFCSGNRRRILASVNKNGVLGIEDIHRLWRKKKELLTHEDHLISVMVHLDILASPRNYNKDGNLVRTDYFFVPSLVKASDESIYAISQEKTIGLSFKFYRPVIPPGIGYRLLASCIDLYEVKRQKGKAMLFSGMTVLAVKHNLDLVVVLRTDRVDIYLVHNKSRTQIIADTAVGIAECIRDILSRIVDSFKLISSDSKRVLLDSQSFLIEYTCPSMKSPCYNNKKEDWICQCGFDIKRELYSKWTTNRKNENCEAGCTGIGGEDSCEKPSELQLAKLALEFAWQGQLGLKELLLHLGLKENEMQAIDADSYGNDLNTRFLSLRKWKQKLDGTIRDIYEAMKETGNDLHLLCRMNRDRYLSLTKDAFEKKVPSDRDLDAVSAEVITESLLLAVQLEVPASTWQQMKADNYKIVNINREILGKWRRESTGKNKMQQLAQALCNVGISITSILKDL